VSALHVPIMPQEVLQCLQLQPGDVVVDCTAGAGGHLQLLCEGVGSTGCAVAIDRDPRAHAADAAGGVVAAHAWASLHALPFSNVGEALHAAKHTHADALFADLGVSSMQLDDGDRGFSFRADAPLDMRMDTTSGPTAYEWLLEHNETEVADAIYRFGEERQSRRIAKAIKQRVPRTTLELAALVQRTLGGARGRIHPATRTFQALRIAVNGELDELVALLAHLPTVMRVGGRVAVLSFHSLEDRLVKQALRQPGFEPVTKKPLTATTLETHENPRARSAKLRAARFVGVPAADQEAA
jgi:16S rRNA (cytosine1402-N4)-methyltransferase